MRILYAAFRSNSDSYKHTMSMSTITDYRNWNQWHLISTNFLHLYKSLMDSFSLLTNLFFRQPIELWAHNNIHKNIKMLHTFLSGKCSMKGNIGSFIIWINQFNWIHNLWLNFYVYVFIDKKIQTYYQMLVNVFLSLNYNTNHWF